MSEHGRDDYISNAAWLRPTGRPDAIDEVADQFERPTGPPGEVGTEAFWRAEEAPRWPLAPRGWRTLEYRVSLPLERRAG